jgi:hypothetical protein
MTPRFGFSGVLFVYVGIIMLGVGLVWTKNPKVSVRIV